MHTLRRTRTLAAVCLLALAAAGCSADAAPGEDAPAATSAPSPSATWLPALFERSAITALAIDEGADVAAGDAGIASIAEGRIVLIDPGTGTQLWESDAIEGTPQLGFVTHADVRYLTAAYGVGTATVRLDSYRVSQPGPKGSIAYTDTVETGGESSVTFLPHGVLSAAGETKLFTVPGESTTALKPSAKTLVGDAVVLASEDGSFSAESLGGKPLWSSSEVTPEGVADASAGKFLGSRGGLVVASWPAQKTGFEVVVLIRALTGEIVVSLDHEGTIPAGAPKISTDGRWASIPGYVVRLENGTYVPVPGDLKVASIEQAVVFGMLPEESKGKAEEKPKESPAAWDSITREYLDDTERLPEVISPSGYAAFRHSSQIEIAQLNSLGGK